MIWHGEKLKGGKSIEYEKSVRRIIMFFYVGGGKWQATVVLGANVTRGRRVKQTGCAAARLHWGSPAGKVAWVNPFLTEWRECRAHVHLCPLQLFKYAHVWGHVSLNLAGTEFCFFFLFLKSRAGTSISPDGKMVLYNMKTDCLWHKGRRNRDTLYHRPGQAWWHCC